MAEYRRVLVTGGAGFIGSNYVHYALAEHPQWRVKVLDKLTYSGNLDNLSDVMNRIEFIHGDIADTQDVARAMDGTDAVINFAAETHVDRSLIDSRPFVRTNVEGTLVLLEMARKCDLGRFVHVSTDEVYGDLSGTNAHSLEADPMRPRSPYAATKASAEHLVFSYIVSYGVDAVVTRGCNTYGPYQYPEKIIPLFITNALDDKPLPIYGDGSAVRDYMHSEDHAAGVDFILHHGESGRTYNLGCRHEISGLEVASRILEYLDKPQELMRFVPDRPGHDYRYSVDPSAAEALGWGAKLNWTEGLEETIRWYRDNQVWWRRIRGLTEFQSHHDRWYTEGNRTADA